MKTINHFIQGKEVSGSSGKFLDVYDPATGEASGRVDCASKADVNRAVTAAQEAFSLWSTTSVTKRSKIIFRYKELMESHLDELAMLVTAEHGKTFADAQGSVKRGIEVVELACNAPHFLQNAFSDNVSSSIDCYTIKQPLGVCVGITPFNFPAMVPNWMFAIAIACGNTFVLKPSEKDPSCALRMAELFQEAGLPNGVLNIIQGDKEAVDALITHPEVKAVSIVGSTPVVQHVYQSAIKQGKRAQGFGGAKNHCVVMPDANLDAAADALVGAAYGSAGERCMAISVVVPVGAETAVNLSRKIQERIPNFKIGAGDDPTSDMGPLVTRSHLDKVKSYVDVGVEEGAKLVVDGRGLTVPGYESGFFMGPCLFDHVTPDMRIYKEEIFGPVLSIVREDDLQGALKLINSHPYANGTAIFTNSGKAAREFTQYVQVGMVGVNIPIPVPAANHSFGGWKASIFGDTNMYGEESFRFYTKLKTVTMRWIEDIKIDPQFVMPVHE